MTVQGILGLGRARRTVIRFLSIAIAALAIPAAMFVTPLTASAASDVSICESFGNFCLGSDDLNLFTAVVERDFPGRKFDTDPLNGTFDGFPTYLLRFHADTSKCVAATNNFANVTIHPCDGGSGVVWARDTSGDHDRWINRLASQNKGSKQYLSGHNEHNSQYFLTTLGGVSGARQQFDLI